MSNPALGAETGDTITTGFVWGPDFANWIDGLQVSVDWYDIDLSNAVTPYGAQRIIDDCYATGVRACATSSSAARPGPRQTYGPISRILNQNINADRAQTRGVDLEFIWAFEPDFVDADEGLSIRGLLGRLHENSTTTAAGRRRTRPAARRARCTPESSPAYTLGKWGLMLQGDYYHSTMNNITWVEGSMSTTTGSPRNDVQLRDVVSHRDDERHGWGLSFNITNLTDQEPSIVANATGQTIVMGHDALGRRYQLSFNMDF